MTSRTLAAVMFGLTLLAILGPMPAEAGGRYSGDSRRGDPLPAAAPLANSFSGRYEGEARFTEKSIFRNSENNRSQFKNSFSKRSVFGNRVERTSRLKHRFNHEAAVRHPLPVLPDLEISQPAQRSPGVTTTFADHATLDPAIRQAIARDLRSIFARDRGAEAGSPR